MCEHGCPGFSIRPVFPTSPCPTPGMLSPIVLPAGSQHTMLLQSSLTALALTFT